jgi:putative sigma-54 modulation protein
MKVLIQDRTEELKPKLRGYAERRLGRLSRHFERVLEAEVHVNPESKRGGEAEKAISILVHMDGRKKPLLKGEARGKELQVILDVALDKVDRQVLKLKDKIVHRHRLGPTPSPDDVAPATVIEPPERVITWVKAESVGQAQDALEANGHLFHLFLDEDDGSLNLIYRRSDGSMAILEPRPV